MLELTTDAGDFEDDSVFSWYQEPLDLLEKVIKDIQEIIREIEKVQKILKIIREDVIC